MKALVTGSTGFIGSHLVEALLGRGDDVFCLIRKTSNLQWIKDLAFHPVYGEYDDKPSLVSAARGMDVVFHVGAAIIAPDWKSYYEANTRSTQNLVEACVTGNPGMKKFVFISSISAAGPSERGKTPNEDDPCRPVSLYGLSKLLAEQIVLEYKDNIPVSILRPPNVIGPRQKELFDAMKLVKKRIKPLMNKDEPRTSLCSVVDVVRAAILLSEKAEADGKIYFVTDSHAYTWAEITDAIAEFLNIRRFILRVPYALQVAAAFVSEKVARAAGRIPLVTRESITATRKYYWIYDGSRIERELGFRATMDMRETVRCTVDWYKKRGML
jgi:nucleoside-diphosphate-sugar epimerase